MYSPNNSSNFTSCLHSSKNFQIAVQTPSVHLALVAAAADAMRAGIQILRDFRAEFANFSTFGEEFRYLPESGLRSVIYWKMQGSMGYIYAKNNFLLQGGSWEMNIFMKKSPLIFGQFSSSKRRFSRKLSLYACFVSTFWRAIFAASNELSRSSTSALDPIIHRSEWDMVKILKNHTFSNFDATYLENG